MGNTRAPRAPIDFSAQLQRSLENKVVNFKGLLRVDVVDSKQLTRTVPEVTIEKGIVRQKPWGSGEVED